MTGHKLAASDKIWSEVKAEYSHKDISPIYTEVDVLFDFLTLIIIQLQ